MTNRAILAFVLFILCPLGIAAWILGSFTVGESLAPEHAIAIGFAVALLVVTTAAYLVLFSTLAEKPGSRLGQTLILCGAACVLMAVALQFYLASLASENARRSGDLLVNVHLPPSVSGAGYLALFLGAWLAAVGVRLGAGQGEKLLRPAATEGRAGLPEPAKAVETGIRAASAEPVAAADRPRD